MKLKTTIAAVALSVATTAAFAAVTFNYQTGEGFVGKGDVQTAFGWKNATIQKYATGVEFEWVTSSNYTAVCTWTTAEGKPGEKEHNVNHKQKIAVKGTVNGDPRQTKGQNQFTGFILSAWNSEVDLITTGTVPVVGEPCMGNEGHGGTWSSVSDPSPAADGGLYAFHTAQIKRALLSITTLLPAAE
jgi:hypothetical protein